jgi:hypothetical protein
VINESAGILKEAAMAYFKVLSKVSPGIPIKWLLILISVMKELSCTHNEEVMSFKQRHTKYSCCAISCIILK